MIFRRSGARSLSAVLAAFVFVLPIAFSPAPDRIAFAENAQADAERLGEAMALREELGLPSDSATVAALVYSDRDVGTALWGIPMTADEEKQIDLAGRMQFADDVDISVLPLVRNLDTYAGAYFDSRHDGGLTILLTTVENADLDRLADVMPRVVLGASKRPSTPTVTSWGPPNGHLPS